MPEERSLRESGALGDLRRHLDLPVAAIAPEDAAEHFGWLAGFLAADVPASSALTRELLGWDPSHPGLLEDLDQGHYFEHREP